MIDSVYWDSVTIIDWIENKRQDRLNLLRPVVEGAIRGELIIITAAVGMAETVRVNGSDLPIVEPMTDEEDERIQAFFRNKYIDVRPVDRVVAERSRQIQRESMRTAPKIKLADSIHIATALEAGCYTMHTFDADHLVRANERFGNGPSKLKITLPSYTPKVPKPPTMASNQLDMLDKLESSLGPASKEQAPSVDGVWFLHRRHQIHPLRSQIRLAPMVRR